MNMRCVRIVINWGLVLVWMTIIFCLSHESSLDSSIRSGVVVNFLLSLGFEKGMADFLSTIVRKSAHMMLYLVLEILNYRAWRSLQKKPSLAMIIASVFTVLFAISDEIHQTFVPGRSGEIGDVIIDVFGIIIGATLIKIFSLLNVKSKIKTIDNSI